MLNKTISAIILITVVSIGTCYFIKRDKRSNTGTVIILNGPSAAGKSSIQKEFQKMMMPKLWIKLGIDNLFDLPMPDITPATMDFWQSPNDMRWVETTKDPQNNNVITLFVGKEGERVIYSMNSAIAAYAQNDCNIIVDYIAYKPEWFADLQDKLKNYKAYYIAVDIPLEILEQREASRGTSPQGHARSHYFTVYGNKQYDLRVNSHTNSAQEIARQIQELLKQDV